MLSNQEQVYQTKVGVVCFFCQILNTSTFNWFISAAGTVAIFLLSNALELDNKRRLLASMTFLFKLQIKVKDKNG